MGKQLKHVGVLGMRWGVRKGSDSVTRGSRTTTRDEFRDEWALRIAVTAKSKNPHTERKEADLIMDRASSESGKNLDKALNRYASENDLRSAVKKGYIKPPLKNVMEMSTKEINQHLNSDPSIKKHLAKDHDASVKRGKIIAGTILATYALIKITDIVVSQMVMKQALNNVGDFYK
jgi:hypothetical protein